MKATTYKISRLNGDFNYAIKIAGNKYISTSEISRSSKIAIEVTPLIEYLRLTE